jgi:cytoskeletal protein CcmA (bactofilin family)
MKLVKGNSNNADLGLISQGIEVSGEVVFTGRLNVEGKITGKLVSDNGVLIVEETGHVQAQVDVGVCVIRGSLQGDLTAKSRAEIHRTGRVEGDVVTPVLLVEEGAVFNGAVKMTKEHTPRVLSEMVSDQSENKRKIKGV